MECIFCTDVRRAGEIVFEDELSWVLLHPDSAVAGHAMVVARRHVENISDLTRQEWLHLAAMEQDAERILLEETGAARAILLKLGIQTPHLHLHIYPVSAELERSAVMAIMDAKVVEERDRSLAERLRARFAQRPRARP